MKRLLLNTLTVVLSIICTSCNFTENITINPDGTGSVSMDMDASQLMALARDEFAKEGAKRMDTTISFKDMFDQKKDSIAQLPQEEQQRLKAMENFTLKMLMDPNTQEMKFSLNNNFRKIEDVSDLMSAMSNMNPKKAEGMPDMGLDKYKNQYSIYL